jgi:hypothetical protein
MRGVTIPPARSAANRRNPATNDDQRMLREGYSKEGGARAMARAQVVAHLPPRMVERHLSGSLLWMSFLDLASVPPA